MEKYNPRAIEPKWQRIWEEKGIYKTPDQSPKPKFYHLEAFPYSSGDTHIGHWYAYTPSDIYARFKRLRGFNVLCPMGFDSFGLPAEGAAIKKGVPPSEWTENSVTTMVRQFKTMGNTYDWDRMLATHRPEYYRWTQWLFLKLHERGLAYKAKALANWCPSCKSILANEQAEGGKCWRCKGPVEQKEVEQWFFKIVDYADELLDSLKELDWPEKTLLMQRNWIGRSEGVEIDFPIKGVDRMITVFTTRPDTVHGITFMVVAPEYNGLFDFVTEKQKKEVESYVEAAKRKTERERISEGKEKTGVFTGSYATNPLTGEEFPIWVADYAVAIYGTGAVMGVPAYDERDREFVEKYGLKNKDVPLEKGGFGRKKINYHLRDWLVSRQRYWGAPIPIIYCSKCGTVPVPEKDLPVLLPPLDDYTSCEGESPLARVKEYVSTTCPQCLGPARRETDTMDTFVCSSWYYLRYTTGNQLDMPFDKELVRHWMPVDCYTIGAEHTVLHLLYSRFMTKVLRDLGYLNFSEPFKKIRHQGMILGEDHDKMSKSRGNVANPDEYVAKYGADTVRMYLAFMGPWDQGGTWDSHGIEGVFRFLNKVWNLFSSHVILGRSRATTPESVPLGSETDSGQARVTVEVSRALNQLIKKVGEDIENMKFNTAVAAFMEFMNQLSAADCQLSDEDTKKFLVVLSPFAPHMTEELWEAMGEPFSIHQQSWPEYDKKLVAEESVVIAVQVNGKTRDTIKLSKSLSEKEVLAAARESKAKGYLKNGVRKEIYVPGKVVNFVVV